MCSSGKGRRNINFKKLQLTITSVYILLAQFLVPEPKPQFSARTDKNLNCSFWSKINQNRMGCGNGRTDSALVFY